MFEICLSAAGYKMKVITDELELYELITKKSKDFLINKPVKADAIFLIKKKKSIAEAIRYFKNVNEKKRKITRIKKMANESKPNCFQALRLSMISWLIEKGCVVMHASSVKTKDGDILLFSGPSGSGKTTIARIAMRAGLVVLQEDEAIIKKVGNEYKAYAFPLIPEHHENYKNTSGKLRAIIFVSHGHKKNILKKLDMIDSYKNLLSNDFFMHLSTMLRVKKEYIHKLSRAYYLMLKEKSFYTLKFIPNEKVMRYLNEKI